MIAAALQPYAVALGIRLENDAILPCLVMPFQNTLTGRTGFIHGGAIAGLLTLVCDEAAGVGARPFSTSFQFLRGAREQQLYAAATIAFGARIATATATAWQTDRERPIASVVRKYQLSRI